jgi:AcrR family transcriptional regulator
VTTSANGEAGRRRRSDFEHNRTAILQAADDAFAEVGPDVSINAIAKRAGVAPATIYRHFANRHALGAAVYELRLDTYTAVVKRGEQHSDPAESFRQTIHGIVELQSRDRSFRDLIGTYEETLPDVDGPSKLAEFGGGLLATFDRARAAGAVRADVTNEDIALLLLASEGIARLAAEQSSIALHRVVNLILDGVMSTRTELDGSALSHEALFKFT